MKIPKSVKIGGIVYKVLQLKDWESRDEADGELFIDQKHGNVIYIYSELTQEAKEVTLLHEILHCMNSTVSHEFLDSLSEQLYQAIKDNDLIFE